MSTHNLVNDAQKQSSGGAVENRDSPIQVRIIQVPANCGPITAMTAQHASPSLSKSNCVTTPHKILHSGQGQQPTSSTITVQGSHLSPSVVVVAKTSTPGGLSLGSQHVVTPGLLQAGKKVVITVPRSAVSNPVTSTPPQNASSQLPANIHIPPGMMLIRSDSGQLMMVSQQVLAQAQQGQRSVSGQAAKIITPQVPTSTGSKSIDSKVKVIRMAAPSSLQTASAQKSAVVVGVAPKMAINPSSSAGCERGKPSHIETISADSKKDPGMTVSQETLESVKKCKNFLITLIKLASSDTRSSNMADNVRRLVRNLLEGKLEAEEFTEQLYEELKSTPQPCLVPFLKKSLPAVRRLTADPQLFIQEASVSSRPPKTLPCNTKQSTPDSGHSIKTSQQGLTSRPGFMTLAQTKSYLPTRSEHASKHSLVQSGKPIQGTFSVKQLVSATATHSTKCTFKENSGSYKEDDDINDVAFMAGVNLGEENARIMTTMVGSVVQSCQDQLFLSPQPLLSRILQKGLELGITEVGPEVVAVVSHATQERLRQLIEKLTMMAQHRKVFLTEDQWHVKVSDVRPQLRFLEETEILRKKRKDAVEREMLLRLAKSRSQTEDPQLQQLKQRARELKQIEEAQQQQREANLTALAAIGPRKKRPPDQTNSQVCVLLRQGVQRVTRVILKDLLLCMEQEASLRHSLTLYKAML